MELNNIQRATIWVGIVMLIIAFILSIVNFFVLLETMNAVNTLADYYNYKLVLENASMFKPMMLQ